MELFEAIEKNKIELVEELFKVNPDIQYGNGCFTSLMYASGWGRIECVQLLLKAGANPNEQTWDGITALMFASRSGAYKCLQLLLQAGANPYIKDIFGRSALTEISYNDYKKIVKILKRMHMIIDYY